MEKTLTILSAMFTVAASFGFLSILQYWDRKIKRSTQDDLDSITTQRDVGTLLEKTNDLGKLYSDKRG